MTDSIHNLPPSSPTPGPDNNLSHSSKARKIQALKAFQTHLFEQLAYAAHSLFSKAPKSKH